VSGLHSISWLRCPIRCRSGSAAAAKALDEIAERRNVTRAEAARSAIVETADRERKRSGLADEARRLMQDKAYVDEAREVAGMMEQLRGTW
jgi:hypothetical protein